MAYFVLIDILLLWIKEGVYQVNSLVYTWRDRIESSGNTQSNRFKNNTSRRGAAFLTIISNTAPGLVLLLILKYCWDFPYENNIRMGNYAVAKSTYLIYTPWKQFVVFKAVELQSHIESSTGNINCLCQCYYLRHILICSLSSWRQRQFCLWVLQNWT